MFTIGKLSEISGLSRDCLRYYEREGLLSPCEKNSAGYRLYDSTTVERLQFIQHAKRCGFTLTEINQLLALKASESACCNDINHVAREKKIQLDKKIEDLRQMSAILEKLIHSCCNDHSSLEHCVILNKLEE